MLLSKYLYFVPSVFWRCIPFKGRYCFVDCIQQTGTQRKTWMHTLQCHSVTNCMLFFFFFPGRAARISGILVPRLGIEPGAMAVKVPSPNYWTAREFSINCTALQLYVAQSFRDNFVGFSMCNQGTIKKELSQYHDRGNGWYLSGGQVGSRWCGILPVSHTK